MLSKILSNNNGLVSSSNRSIAIGNGINYKLINNNQLIQHDMQILSKYLRLLLLAILLHIIDNVRLYLKRTAILSLESSVALGSYCSFILE